MSSRRGSAASDSSPKTRSKSAVTRYRTAPPGPPSRPASAISPRSTSEATAESAATPRMRGDLGTRDRARCTQRSPTSREPPATGHARPAARRGARTPRRPRGRRRTRSRPPPSAGRCRSGPRVPLAQQPERRLDPLEVVCGRLGELIERQRLRSDDEQRLDRAGEPVDRVRGDQAERAVHCRILPSSDSGDPDRGERRSLRDRDLALLAELEQSEERNCLLDAREALHLGIEIEAAATPQQRPKALHEL